MRREAQYWLLLAWCVLVYWPLRIAALIEGRGMDRVPRSVAAYLTWLGTLTAEQLVAVHQASDWFATVHARDMDGVYAALAVLEERIRRIEAQRHANGSD